MSKGGPIWPGGKSAQGQPLKPTEEAFELHKEVSAPGVKSSGGASKVAETSTQVQAQKTQDAAPTTQIKNLSVKCNFPHAHFYSIGTNLFTVFM